MLLLSLSSSQDLWWVLLEHFTSTDKIFSSSVWDLHSCFCWEDARSEELVSCFLVLCHMFFTWSSFWINVSSFRQSILLVKSRPISAFQFVTAEACHQTKTFPAFRKQLWASFYFLTYILHPSLAIRACSVSCHESLFSASFSISSRDLMPVLFRVSPDQNLFLSPPLEIFPTWQFADSLLTPNIIF